MKYLKYVLYLVAFLYPFAKLYSLDISAFGITLVVDMSSAFISNFIIFWVLFLELIPFILSKIKKSFDYKEYRLKEIQYVKIFLIYTVIFLIGTIIWFLIMLVSSNDIKEVQENTQYTFEERLELKEKCNNLVEATSLRDVSVKEVFYSYKKDTCIVSARENKNWWGYIVFDLILDTPVYVGYDYEEYNRTYQEYR